ncbi:urease accessory protein UreF [Jannaschia sp. S6380]|uniref:urease accessory protein UreF n=1 Tax=Jannaschia sp. S6380 TaxID=2926408 RepID=UPI001FF46EAB|nr:urease accessory UreF family protein [Jannaschia sp. S6380]MCK0167347.1 urease accessory protein UreF [Jannaschia sp. S6380]
MTDTVALVRLMSWLTPAMPTGGFAWSGGLEAAVREKCIENKDALGDWMEDVLRAGPMRVDAALLARAMAGEEVSELALALATSPGRAAETEEQGDAFLTAAAAWMDGSPTRPCALPAAVGWAARAAGLSAEQTVAAYLHAQVAAALQAALRLMPLGQTGSTRLMARLEPTIVATARDVIADPNLGTVAFGAEIAALRHGTLPARLFRS